MRVAAIILIAACALPLSVTAKIHRSHTARADFKHQQPCPSNGRVKGSCPGYVIDHIHPLGCGGHDTPSNMQWQTVADAKAKDKWERRVCGR